MGRDERLNMSAREAAPLLDRFRRPLFPGVKVEFHPRLPIVYDIVDIRPVVDPRQPAGLWQLTLSATIGINAFGGAPIEELTAIVFPKAVDADRKPDQPAQLEPESARFKDPIVGRPPGSTQDNDSPAGPDQYHPPEGDDHDAKN
jgi:hypothetical protein